jgi:5'-nucleotidase
VARFVLVSLAFGVTVACAPSPKPCASPTPPTAEACLRVVSWNDLHGQLEPEEAWVDLNKVPAGGVVALADHVDALRKQGEPVFVLDAGDLFTGPMESTLAEGAPVIAGYDALGLDAATIGNHEFDFGPVGYERVVARPGTSDADGADGPRGALLKRFAEARFPFVSANVRTAAGATPAWPNVKPWTIVERGGFKLGVIGYSTRETPTTTLKPNVEGLTFDEGAVEHVRAGIRALRAAGAAPVVLLAHASIDGELPQDLADDKPRAGELSTLFKALGTDLPDLTVAGHRHAWMLGRVQGVPVVSSDQHGVGHAVSRFCRGSDGSMSLRSVDRRVTFASTPPTSELGRQVHAAVRPWIDAIRAQADTVIASLPKPCQAQGPTGTALQEAIATAILERAHKDGMIPAGATAVAVVNAGGVRMPLKAGPVRNRDLFAVLPFENAISTCTTTKAGMTRAFGNLAKRVSARDRFPFGIAGADVKAHRAPDVPLVLDAITPAGSAAGASQDEVILVMPDFLLFGGDGFLEGVACSATKTSPVRIRDAFTAAMPASCDGAAKHVSVD